MVTAECSELSKLEGDSRRAQLLESTLQSDLCADCQKRRAFWECRTAIHSHNDAKLRGGRSGHGVVSHEEENEDG